LRLSFHGADQGVTGSCHLLQCCGKRILIDCGLYQGSREIEEVNHASFGFDPASIDYLLLTHGHLDHCGRIPLLFKRGFEGEIICTSATRELARLVMLDSAHLQEEDARWKMRKAKRRGKDARIIEPLYTELDALDSLDYFGRTASYDKPMPVCEGVQATFLDAGHILGSASILLQVNEDSHHKRILFSGDLGYSGRVILRDPEPPPAADIVVMETTYGDRKHKELEPSIDELYQAVHETFDRGGNVIIPTFAIERAQEILYYLREGVSNGDLPSFMQVFLDSPMAISATEIFRHHPECYDQEAAELFRNHNDPFDLPGLHFTRETAESMALNQIDGGAVIMAGSGMCTGGRVRHHLKHNLWRKDCSIVFVGFAARGTLARKIVDGAKEVRIFGEEMPVRASIYTIGGFSAHADCDELYRWYRHTGNPEKTFLVHGEEEAMQAFAHRIGSHKVSMPALHEEFSFG
jgi:metallo-beta-lactamase family protein